MLKTYRAAFRAPGSAAFCAAGFVAEFSIAVYPIAFVLLIALRTGHYGFAGLLSGTYVLVGGIGGLVLSRWVDRFGQARVLLPAAIVHGLGVAVVIVLAEADAPDWTLLLPAAVVGASYIPMGSLVRARWSFVLGGRPELTTAYAIQSILDEVIFTVAPLLATVIATQIDPKPVFIVAAGLVSAGSLWLRSERATEPPASPAGAAPHASALRSAGMGWMVIASIGMGAFFASAEVTMVAFCSQHGHTKVAGLMLASFAFGSGVSGFVYGARRHPATMLDRFRRQCVLFGVLSLSFLAAVNVPVVAVLAFIAGTGIAPALITSFGLIEEIVPTEALTEGMSWLNSGLSIGYGIAASVVGRVADAHGARPAFGLAIASGAFVAVSAAVLHARVAPSSRAVVPR